MDEDERLEALKVEIRNRLRPVCTNMSEESFEELVQKVAEQARRSLRPHLQHHSSQSELRR